MSGKNPNPNQENKSNDPNKSNEPVQSKSKDKKFWELTCACCNQDIRDNKYIGIVYYGTMINLCGDPCGIRDYLETQ